MLNSHQTVNDDEAGLLWGWYDDQDEDDDEEQSKYKNKMNNSQNENEDWVNEKSRNTKQ